MWCCFPCWYYCLGVFICMTFGLYSPTGMYETLLMCLIITHYSEDASSSHSLGQHARKPLLLPQPLARWAHSFFFSTPQTKIDGASHHSCKEKLELPTTTCNELGKELPTGCTKILAQCRLVIRAVSTMTNPPHSSPIF